MMLASHCITKCPHCGVNGITLTMMVGADSGGAGPEILLGCGHCGRLVLSMVNVDPEVVEAFRTGTRFELVLAEYVEPTWPKKA